MDICEDGYTPLLITERGFGKRTELDEYRSQNRGGKGLITYKISDKTGEIAGMMMVNDEHDVMLITNSGIIIRIHAKDINIIGRATRGVTLMRTSDTNYIVSCARTDYDEGEEAAVVENEEVPAEVGEETPVTEE